MSTSVEALWGNRKVIGVLAGIVLVLGCVLFYLLSGQETPTGDEAGEQTAKVEGAADTSADITVTKTETKPVPEAARAAQLPASPVSLEKARKLSDQELLGLVKREDSITLSSVVLETGQRKSPELLRAILTLASNADYKVRTNVLRVFSDRSIRYTDDLRSAAMKAIAARLDDEDEIVRGFAAKALSSIGDKGAITLLENRMKVEDSPIVGKMLKASLEELKR